MNEAIAAGVDIFNGGPHHRALSAGPIEQRWFFHAVLEASEAFSDSRLEPMRERLREEAARFERLTGDEG